MARKERIFVVGGIYHVYCRVARGEPVFDSPTEVDNRAQVVSYVSWIHGLTILAWCLMSNHYHLVVRTSTMPLWRAMAALQGRVARRFNRRHCYMGRLWQSRYKARVVQDQEYLDYLFAYVHLNPVAAGIVEDPSDFAASGHAELLGLVKPGLCDVKAALSYFDSDQKNARQIYEQQVRVVAEARWLSTGVRDLPWWRTVDDDEETLPKEEAPSGATDFVGQPLPPEAHQLPDLADVLRLFDREMGLGHGELAGRSRVRILSWYRCMFSTLAVSRLGYRTKEVAGALCKASGSISRWVSEGLEMQRSDREFRESLDRLGHRFNHEWYGGDMPATEETPESGTL